MVIEQMYTNCLAEAAYYIESNGEAAIIDPIRETAPYIEKAAQRGVKIKYVFETHFHADFVSGHIDLAKKPGAKIIFGPGADTFPPGRHGQQAKRGCADDDGIARGRYAKAFACGPSRRGAMRGAAGCPRIGAGVHASRGPARG